VYIYIVYLNSERRWRRRGHGVGLPPPGIRRGAVETSFDARVEDALPLRPPVFEILLALGDGPLHGYAIIQALRAPDGPGVEIQTGPLYRHLKRLLDHGLISQSEDPPPGTEDDERRKAYYALTPLGRGVVQAEGHRLSRLVRETRRLGFLPEAGG
jgi:DNA-binding PadR family transcriptional regulator